MGIYECASYGACSVSGIVDLVDQILYHKMTVRLYCICFLLYVCCFIDYLLTCEQVEGCWQKTEYFLRDVTLNSGNSYEGIG